MLNFRIILLVWIGLLLWSIPLHAQTKPTEEKKTNGFTKVSKRVKDLLHQNPGDTIMNKKSEVGYTQYQGKIIRNITINHIGFERDINDTSRYKMVNDMARLANSLHQNTKEQTIRNNLFIRENKPLDPYKLADNERLLRDLNFILDARIIVKPIHDNTEMVDLLVVTRDVFSLGGSFSTNSATSFGFKIYDANLGGRGQRVQYSGLVDYERQPNFGQQLLYNKNSVKGSFINATVSYTQLNNGSSYGQENENALFIRLDRPLVSPYTRWAGGGEFSRNWAVNAYQIDNTSFLNYTYYVKDFWIGYNIGINNKMKNRNRHFVAIRTFQQRFTQQPVQPAEELNILYNDQTYVLGELTFYNRNFYRTKYIYGFGRTEDVPYGRKLTILAGDVKQLGYHRPYLGAEYDKSIFHKSGDFREFSFRAGGFEERGKFQDITLLASASIYSRLIPMGKNGLRQSLGINYTTILNPTISMPLRIDNEFGIQKLRSDSLIGTQRLGVHAETVMFTKPTLLGFHFAPFVFADMAMIARKDETLFKRKPYFGLGGGVRTRNENLIFGTIELRLFYFPRVPEDLSHFKITLSSNLRVKYSSGFVSAPSFIRYN